MRSTSLVASIVALAALATPPLARGQYRVDVYPSDRALNATDGAVHGGSVPAYGGGPFHAVIWTDHSGPVTHLEPEGASASMLWGVGGGQQVGYVAMPTGGGAALWTGSAASFVSLHPQGYAFSHADATSGTQQVGEGYRIAENRQHALLWTGSARSVVDLNPAGYVESRANAVARGQQVGSAAPTFNAPHATIWTGTAASAVDVHPAGYSVSELYGTNGSQQVGYAVADVKHHAMLWSGTADSAVDLHPDQFGFSYAWGLNATQQVGIGYSADGRTSHALLWSGTKESLVDLHAFVPTRFTTSAAESIDPQGNIYGIVTDGTNVYRAIWTVPEPVAGALLAPLALSCLARPSRKR